MRDKAGPIPGSFSKRSRTFDMFRVFRQIFLGSPSYCVLMTCAHPFKYLAIFVGCLWNAFPAHPKRMNPIRACGHSFECEATVGEVYHRGIARVGFFVSRGDAPERLEIAEKILDEMAPFVHREVARDRAHPIGLGWNDGHGASAVQFGADPVDVEGLVGQQGLEVDTLDQRRNADAVVALAGKQQEARQVAERIDERDDFRRQPASRSADGLILSPPLAPVPCWWTRTMVPSMMAYSKSGSGDNSLNRLSNTPFSAHRRKRR